MALLLRSICGYPSTFSDAERIQQAKIDPFLGGYLRSPPPTFSDSERIARAMIDLFVAEYLLLFLNFSDAEKEAQAKIGPLLGLASVTPQIFLTRRMKRR